MQIYLDRVCEPWVLDACYDFTKNQSAKMGPLLSKYLAVPRSYVIFAAS